MRSILKIILPISIISCAATEAQNASVFDLSLKELLDIKIVSATMQEETLLSIPASSSVFTRKDWQKLGITTIDELMALVPGFQSYRGDNTASQSLYSSRGRRNGYGSREILFLVDGVRLNDDYAGGSFYNYDINLDNAERVEFIRGPGSATHGANAFLGVVHIITASRRGFRLESSTDDHNRAVFHLQKNLYEIDLGIDAEVEDRQGQIYSMYSPSQFAMIEDSDGYERSHLTLRAKYKNFTFKTSYSNCSENHFYFQGLLSDYKVSEQSQHRFSLNYERQLNELWHTQASYNMSRADQDGAINPIVNPFGNLAFLFEENNDSANIRFNYNAEGGSRAVFGIDWRKSEHPGDYSWTTYPTPAPLLLLNETGSSEIFGLYAQWQQKLYKNLKITAGLRHDAYSNQKDRSTPRLALVYDINTTNALKFLYGEAFRAPTWTERFVTNNAFFIGNPNLEPELARTYELVWSHLHDDTLFQASIFHVDISQSMLQNPLSLMWENIGTEKIEGLEVEWRSPLSQNWEIFGSFSWIYNPAREKNTEASEFGGLALLYSIGNFSTSFQLQHIGQRNNVYAYNNSIPALNSHQPLAFYLAYKKEDYRFYLKISNAMDEENFAPANNSGNFVGVPIPGREIKLGVSAEF